MGNNYLFNKKREDNARLVVGNARVVVHNNGVGSELPETPEDINKICSAMEILSPPVKQTSMSKADFKIEDWKMNINEDGGIAIIAQMEPAGYWKSIAGTVAAVGITAIAATGVGAPVSIALIGMGAAGGLTFWIRLALLLGYSPWQRWLHQW